MFRKIISNVIESTHPIETVYPCPFTLKDTSSFSWLMNYAPCFPINAANIKILTSPKEFYQAVVSHCESATQRVTMASLYVGNGELEKRIVTALRNNKSFKENKLKVNFLLDYNRGSRYKNNSRRMLLPLVQDNNKTCMVSLYHTPLLRANIRRLMPARWNELCGLQHMKLYIFDDTLIISGANLSHDYFTNRQDRYFMIKDKRLCDFYNTLVGKVQTFSFTLSKKDVPYVHDDWEYSPAFEGDKQEFIEKTGDMIEEYIYDTRMEQNVHKYEGYDTWIFPLIQMGQLGIDQDSVVTEKIFGEAPSGSQLRIASGYFNFTSKYMSTLIHRSQGQCSILMAHPEANGFLGADGPAGGIPYAYSLIAHKFKQQFQKSGQSERFTLLEYLKKGWTYHAKGLWYYAPQCNYPCLTLVGSPNFGERSVKKDLETQLAIVTENDDLKKELDKECKQLYKLGLPADTERSVPKWVHLFVLLFREYF